MPDPVRVNRAPVLTLWAAVVAEPLGHPPDLALTLGQAVAGSGARAKARSLGIASEQDREVEKRGAELRPPIKPVRLLGKDIRLAVREGSPIRRERQDGDAAPACPLSPMVSAPTAAPWMTTAKGPR